MAHKNLENNENLEDRLRQESTGLISGKVITPGEPDYDMEALALLNVTPAEYKKRHVLNEPEERTPLKLYTVHSQSELRDGKEVLKAVPIAVRKTAKTTLSIGVRRDRFVGPLRFGTQVKNEHIEIPVVTYEKTPYCNIQYTVQAPRALGGRTFPNHITFRASRELATQFMQHAEKSPDDVGKILLGLFPGVFDVEREFPLSRYGRGFVPSTPRCGIMYFAHLSDADMEKAGFEFGKLYLDPEAIFSRVGTMGLQYEEIANLPAEFREGLGFPPLLEFPLSKFRKIEYKPTLIRLTR